jgi:hypothetical protein
MHYPIVVLISSLMLIAPVYGIAAQPPSPPTSLSTERCEQQVIAGEKVVVGVYPLHVTVTKIDYENATIDFITEVGTSLHVTQASTYELGQLQIGDTVEMCIAEALQAEAEV